MSENDGGPAFPTTHPATDRLVAYTDYGMSLRDYFAGQALAGWLATYGEHAHPAASEHTDIVAGWSYVMADAMLKARERV